MPIEQYLGLGACCVYGPKGSTTLQDIDITKHLQLTNPLQLQVHPHLDFSTLHKPIPTKPAQPNLNENRDDRLLRVTSRVFQF